MGKTHLFLLDIKQILLAWHPAKPYELSQYVNVCESCVIVGDVYICSVVGVCDIYPPVFQVFSGSQKNFKSKFVPYVL